MPITMAQSTRTKCGKQPSRCGAVVRVDRKVGQDLAVQVVRKDVGARVVPVAKVSGVREDRAA